LWQSVFFIEGGALVEPKIIIGIVLVVLVVGGVIFLQLRKKK